MNNAFKSAGLAAGLLLAGTIGASAATLDFTANNDTTGTIFGTVNWTVSTRGSDFLTNATHKNNVGCTGQGWDFACAPAGGNYDVGFGVNGDGSNNNEIDGKLDNKNEYVEVDFGGDRVQITGFAAMLTYDEDTPLGSGDRELAKLQYKKADGSWAGILAEPLFVIDNDPNSGGNFDTVGLAFLDNLALFTDTVRFRATGRGDSDDGSFNITAAGLKVAPVPLPAGGLLLLTALGGVAALRRKRKAA